MRLYSLPSHLFTQRLEDHFDGANRRNLRHFIVTSEKGEIAMPGLQIPNSIASDRDELEESVSVEERYYYLARDKSATDSVQEHAEDRKELVRIPTCAIFHKFAAGRGVPHSFVGFIRQWPALPQVVVSLPLINLYHQRASYWCTPGRSSCRFVSFRLLGFLQASDTMSTKFVRSKVSGRTPFAPRARCDPILHRVGFYGVTYYIGFREDFKINVSSLAFWDKTPFFLGLGAETFQSRSTRSSTRSAR